MPAHKKDPSVRKRRNTASTATTLRVVAPEDRVPVPALPAVARQDAAGEPVEWLDITRDWWHELWTSPLAPELVTVDIFQLFILADLYDRYWRSPSKDLAGEIRLQRAAFGLSPYDRRRLEWTVEEAESAKDKGRQRRERASAGAVVEPEGEDPRAIMGAV